MPASKDAPELAAEAGADLMIEFVSGLPVNGVVGLATKGVIALVILPAAGLPSDRIDGLTTKIEGVVPEITAASVWLASSRAVSLPDILADRRSKSRNTSIICAHDLLASIGVDFKLAAF